MKKTKNLWYTGKTAKLLFLAVLLACTVIVPVSAEDTPALFTPLEIQEIMTAGLVFSDVFNDSLYNSLDDSAKADYMATVLVCLSEPANRTAVSMNNVPGLLSTTMNQQAQILYQSRTNHILQQYIPSMYSTPLINRESIYYNVDTKTFTFRYSSGVLAMVKLVKDECCNEANESISFTKIQTSTLPDELLSDDTQIRAVSGDKALLIYDIDTTGSRLYNLEYVRDFLLENNPPVTSIIKQNPTVPEYRTLLSATVVSSGYRAVIISSHGDVYSLNLFTNYPSVTLCETTNDVKLDLYSEDLLQNRVGIVHQPEEADRFSLLPSFFEYYYSGNKLNGAYVHLGICKGFGDGLFVDNTLASKFTASGASVVTGYHKEVFITYDHGMIKNISRNLANGSSLESSVNSAKAVHGDTGPNGEYIIVYGNGGWML